jgi:DNA-binding response OmpR family regulator
VQAAAWLDLKRTYMELRPALRRVYLTLCDVSKYASMAQRLGFRVMEGSEVALGGATYHSVVLEFGAGSVDGWLARLAAAELGIQGGVDVLDAEARELVLDERRVPLTPLEFGVMSCLVSRRSKVVSRTDLLRDVWETDYQGGSNVVDTVIRTLRRKLGQHAERIETVTRVGYRWR